MIDQRLIKDAGPVLNDPLAWCLLELRHFRGHVTIDQRGIPRGGLQRRRRDELWKTVDPLELRIAFDRRPGCRELLVSRPAEQKRVELV